MPTYEMPLLLRIMNKPQLVETLKRTSGMIFNTGGFIRRIENWGVKPLPCKISTHRYPHREAHHFFICFDAPPKLIEKITDEGSRDIDIVRIKIYRQIEPSNKNCTFHEEMLPPAYRPSVLKLMEVAKKQQKKKNQFQYNSGLDYYPFTG